MKLSGQFVVRIEPDQHGELAAEARRRGISLNRLCTDLFKKGLLGGTDSRNELYDFLKPTIQKLKKHFQKNILGVILFGSQVTGKATATSDFDLLIVLSPAVSITRALYRFWDESIPEIPEREVNPQFVHAPASPKEAGGIWLETAVAHIILWEQDRKLTKLLQKIESFISQGHARRYWSNGQPYWTHPLSDQMPDQMSDKESVS